MKVFFSLVKIYFASAFNVKNFIAGLQRCKKKKDGTAVTRVSAVKTAGVIVLFVLLAAEFLFVFGFFFPYAIPCSKGHAQYTVLIRIFCGNTFRFFGLVRLYAYRFDLLYRRNRGAAFIDADKA